MSNPIKKVLIDGDIAIYRVGFGCQDREGTVISWPLARSRMDTWIKGVLEGSGCSQFDIFLTADDRTNFRFQIYPEYKANRKSPKPIYYKALREYLVDEYGAVLVSKWEADDAIAMAAAKEGAIIASIDKDLDQVAGWHYDFVKNVKYEITPEVAHRFFYYQLLMGDRVDNIPGIPRVGPVKASAVLDECKSPDEYPVRVYQEYVRYFGEKFAYEQMKLNGRLLWIAKQEGEPLWEPPPSIRNTEAALNELPQEPCVEQN